MEEKGPGWHSAKKSVNLRAPWEVKIKNIGDKVDTQGRAVHWLLPTLVLHIFFHQ